MYSLWASPQRDSRRLIFFALRYPIKKAKKSPYPEGLIVFRFPAGQSFRTEGCHAGDEGFRETGRIKRRRQQDERCRTEKEYGYYMAQKWLESLLDKGKISVAEFNKITEKNRQSFSPFLAEIMPKMT